MKKEITLFKNERCKIWHDEELDALNANWSGFLTIEDVRKGCKAMSSFIKINRTKLHYSNQLNLKVLMTFLKEFLKPEGCLE